MTTKHFVSASCEGEACSVLVPISMPLNAERVVASRKNMIPCGAPATHKVGEEIPDDEPCPACGHAWRYSEDERVALVSSPASAQCGDLYHLFGTARHNLTAYVCCAHFKAIMGSASPCP